MRSYRFSLLAAALAAALAVVPVSVVAAHGDDDDRPQVHTKTPLNITSSSARVRGSVKPRENGADWWFQYGTTTAYGSTTPQVDMGNSGSTQQVAVTLTGLAPETKYFYRVVARNSDGTSFGAPRYFTTTAAGAPPQHPANGGEGGENGDNGTGNGGENGNAGGNGNGTANGHDDDDVAEPPVTPTGTQPELGRSLAVAPAAGVITIKEPGASTFKTLGPSDTVPVGTVVNAMRGTVRLWSEQPSGQLQSGTFWGGAFEVRQARDGGGYTDLHLRGGDLGACWLPLNPPTIAGARRSLAVASARRRTRSRRLWGSDRRGRFRTHGRNSVATVRGTQWSMTDRCYGTVTWVREGAVEVRNTQTGQTTLVTAGHAHLAPHVAFLARLRAVRLARTQR